jgi:hypothetical protein
MTRTITVTKPGWYKVKVVAKVGFGGPIGGSYWKNVYLGECKVEVKDVIKGLIAYYPLDGTAKDLSGKGHDGTVINAVPCPDVNGNRNTGMRFNGNNAVIDCGDVLNNLSTFTMSAWVKIRARVVTDYDGFISEGTDSEPTGNWMFYVGSTSTSFGSSCYWSPRTYIDTRVHHSIALDQWHHVVQTYDGSFVRQYDNGVEVNSTAYSGKSMGNSSSMYLGRVMYAGTTTVHFNGDLDEVRIYNRALSAEEVQQLLQYGRPSGEFFDDFSYAGTDDPLLTNF